MAQVWLGKIVTLKHNGLKVRVTDIEYQPYEPITYKQPIQATVVRADRYYFVNGDKTRAYTENDFK